MSFQVIPRTDGLTNGEVGENRQNYARTRLCVEFVVKSVYTFRTIMTIDQADFVKCNEKRRKGEGKITMFFLALKCACIL